MYISKQQISERKRKKKEKKEKRALTSGMLSPCVCRCPHKQSENEEKGVFFKMMLRMREILSVCVAWATIQNQKREAVIPSKVCPKEGVLILLLCVCVCVHARKCVCVLPSTSKSPSVPLLQCSSFMCPSARQRRQLIG